MADPTALELLARIAAGIERLIALQTPQKPVRVDLDGPHGDPEVKAKDPRDWTGAPMKGRKFSECPAEYLDMLADRFDYFAEREEDAKKAGYDRLDAARARGWAERVRNGDAEPPKVDEDPHFDGRW
jgi:hypothetical protein